MNYGKTPSTHVIGQKITTYSAYSYIMRLGLMIKYINGLIKNILNLQITSYVTKQRIQLIFTLTVRETKKFGIIPKTLSNSHTKTKYTVTTYPKNTFVVTTAKNEETNPNTNNYNTNPQMENKK